MILPDRKQYDAETQCSILHELQVNACVPYDPAKLCNGHAMPGISLPPDAECKVPALRALAVDYYKMRGQVSIARQDNDKAYGAKTPFK